MTAIVNDGPCTFTHDGHTATANGAYLDEQGGIAYITTPDRSVGTLTDWHGTEIGAYIVTGRWTWNSHTARNRMISIRAYVQGREYTGRFGYDWSQAVRLRRSNRHV